MSVIPSSRLRLAELRAVERKERDRFENVWYDRLNHPVKGHQTRALGELLRSGLIELEPQEHSPGFFIARITVKGRRTLADWENPQPVVYSTRRRIAALELAVSEALSYDGGFRHASGNPVRSYLAKPLSDLLRAGLLSVREIPGAVTVTEHGLVHFDRWSDQ